MSCRPIPRKTYNAAFLVQTSRGHAFVPHVKVTFVGFRASLMVFETTQNNRPSVIEVDQGSVVLNDMDVSVVAHEL